MRLLLQATILTVLLLASCSVLPEQPVQHWEIEINGAIHLLDDNSVQVHDESGSYMIDPAGNTVPSGSASSGGQSQGIPLLGDGQPGASRHGRSNAVCRQRGPPSSAPCGAGCPEAWCWKPLRLAMAGSYSYFPDDASAFCLLDQGPVVSFYSQLVVAMDWEGQVLWAVSRHELCPAVAWSGKGQAANQVHVRGRGLPLGVRGNALEQGTGRWSGHPRGTARDPGFRCCKGP